MFIKYIQVFLAIFSLGAFAQDSGTGIVVAGVNDKTRQFLLQLDECGQSKNFCAMPQSQVKADVFSKQFLGEERKIKNPFDKPTSFQRVVEPLIGVSLRKTFSNDSDSWTLSILRKNTLGISYGNGQNLFFRGELESSGKISFKLKYFF